MPLMLTLKPLTCGYRRMIEGSYNPFDFPSWMDYNFKRFRDPKTYIHASAEMKDSGDHSTGENCILRYYREKSFCLVDRVIVLLSPTQLGTRYGSWNIVVYGWKLVWSGTIFVVSVRAVCTGSQKKEETLY